MAALAAAASLLLAASPDAAAGQDARTLDEGAYRLTVDGREIGTETFAVRREGRNVRGVAQIRLDTVGAGLSSMTAWLQTNADFRPDLLRLRPETSDSKSVTAVREGDRLRVQTSSSRGQRSREFVASPGLVLLDARIAHHWFLALKQHADDLAAGGSVRVPAILPAKPARMELEIRRGGQESVEVAGRTLQATRHEVSGQLSAVVWTDDAGRVVKLRLPGEDLTAERTEGAGGS